MKQKAQDLLPGTMVKNSVGEIGRLVHFDINIDGEYFWMIDWPVRGIDFSILAEVQEMEIA